MLDLTQQQIELYEEANRYNEEARYWNYRIKESRGDIGGVIAERIRFDRERAATMRPATPQPNLGEVGETESVGSDNGDSVL